MAEKRKQGVSYRPEVAQTLTELLGTLPGVRQGSTFGHPAFFAGDRVFAFAYRDGVVLKLPGERVRQLLGQPGVVPFQMRGRPPMREWIALHRDDAAAYRDDLALFQEAMAFAAGPAPRPRKAKRRGTG